MIKIAAPPNTKNSGILLFCACFFPPFAAVLLSFAIKSFLLNQQLADEIVKDSKSNHNRHYGLMAISNLAHDCHIRAQYDGCRIGELYLEKSSTLTGQDRLGPDLNLRLNTFLHALLFVMGFSVVFIIGWWGAATAVGQLFGAYKSFLGRIGGVVVIVMGLFTLKVIRILWLLVETRSYWRPGKGGPLLSSIMMGVFFAAGWTPCIGTTLGAILTLGMSQQSAFQAMVLSSGYALGMGLPFLAIGLGLGQAVRLIARFRRYVRWLETASGVLLIVVGLLLLFDRMTVIAIWALQRGYFIDLPLGGAVTPTYLIAVTAGLLSFLSPCVLPLVPAYIGYLSGQAVRNVGGSPIETVR